MGVRKNLFDPRCLELARVFLEGDERLRHLDEAFHEACANALAQDIQATVESFLEFEISERISSANKF